MEKQKMEQIISFLKRHGEANRKDIGKYIGEKQYSDKLKSHLNYLESGKYIQKLSEEIYGITPKGERFVSFDEENEIEKLQIENLRLQNKLLKNRLFYAIMGGVFGFVLANLKDILIMLQLIDK